MNLKLADEEEERIFESIRIKKYKKKVKRSKKPVCSGVYNSTV